ncbi:MAG TPA: YbjN domain-containing protein [Xanthobacteraceae bacterium]|nr:YbjN domain-containing protein [Xanthobacteraceae bacterium]
MNRRSLLAGMVMALGLASGVSRADPGTAEKLETLLKAGDFKSALKVKDGIWTLDFNGKRLPKFKLVLAAGEGIITARVNPVPRDQLPRNRAALTAAILKANADFDYVKFGFDADSDLFVRADMPPGVDDASFKTIVEQTAAAADEFYGRISQYLR